jgi:hypothetical protein
VGRDRARSQPSSITAPSGTCGSAGGCGDHPHIAQFGAVCLCILIDKCCLVQIIAVNCDVLCRSGTWSVTLRAECVLGVLESEVLRGFWGLRGRT